MPLKGKDAFFHPHRGAEFNEFFKAADLQYLKLRGRRYTWIGMGGTKLNKLERFLISSVLLNEWPQVSVLALKRTFADHCPLLLKTTANDYGPVSFRFFDHLMDESGFDVLIKSCWDNSVVWGNPMLRLKSKLKALKAVIKFWHTDNSRNKVQDASKELAAWEARAETEEFSSEEVMAFTKARAAYFESDKLHSLSLKQKSRVKRVADGDENNRFFHGMIRGRLKKNSILGLNINGSWIEDPAAVKAKNLKFHNQQYNEPKMHRPAFSSNKFKSLFSNQATDLERPFSDDEIKQAVWSCEGSKTLGLGGFTISFLKKHWEFLKSDFVVAIKTFESSGLIPNGCNSTFITLVPKVSDPIIPYNTQIQNVSTQKKKLPALRTCHIRNRSLIRDTFISLR